MLVALYLSGGVFSGLAASVFPPENRPPVWLPVLISGVTFTIAAVIFVRGRRLRLSTAGWLSGFLLLVLMGITATSSNLTRATVAGVLTVAVLVLFAWFMPTWLGRLVGYSTLVLFAVILAARYPTNDAGLTIVALGSLSVLLTELLGRFKRDLQQSSLTDHLCGVWNRRGFDLLLDTEIRTVARTDEALSLIFIDLDDFKTVNDSRGHLEGDLVLQRISRGLVENLRSGDCVARVGGDEFVLLLPRTNAGEAASLVSRLKAEVTACGWSFGIAEHRPQETAHELIERSDTIMMQHKRARGDRRDPLAR